MKYNAEYDRWVTKGGLVYRYSEAQGKLILCKLTKTSKGYLNVYVHNFKQTNVLVHRLVYETFVGKIPKGTVIDHTNTIRTDNRLENLRCVTTKENNNNPLTIKHKIYSEFGRKFKEHFGISKQENKKLYNKERKYYIRHNKVCRWE